MPVFRLGRAPLFPPPDQAEPDGLLAIGGDLAPERLLRAYAAGIFPWYNPGSPLLWWSPDPRCVLLPGGLHISRRLRKTLRQNSFEVTFDRAFADVISACAQQRPQTWIVPEMEAAYSELNRLGVAHSVECWQGGELAGGLYGVAVGRCFCGESMFHRRRDASKVAFAVLAATLFSHGFELLDAQLPTPHLESLGAIVMPREEFLRRLQQATGEETGRNGGFPAAPCVRW